MNSRKPESILGGYLFALSPFSVLLFRIFSISEPGYDLHLLIIQLTGFEKLPQYIVGMNVLVDPAPGSRNSVTPVVDPVIYNVSATDTLCVVSEFGHGGIVIGKDIR